MTLKKADLHCRYITRPSDSLIEALSQYESAYKLEENFAAFPCPSYAKTNLEFETSDGRKVHDLCFHLMKLYSRRSYPLERVLNPVAYTSNVLDYRLRWEWNVLLYVSLSSRSSKWAYLEIFFVVGSSWPRWKVSNTITYRWRASIRYTRASLLNSKLMVYGTGLCSCCCTFGISPREYT